MKLVNLRLFEFNECSWIPSILREYSTDFLSFLWCFDGFGMTKPAITPAMELMEKSIKKTKTHEVVDLASGSGEASLKTFMHLKKKGIKGIKLILSDLYPNIDTFKKISESNENISYEEKSVNAMDCDIKGFRTFYASFHHFNKKQAIKILEDTINKSEGIGIFEMTYRGLWNLFLLIGLAPLWIILLTPFIKPVNFTRILFTYFIPLIPLLLWWDGFVSVLRTYNEKELAEMIKLADKNKHYEWQTIKKIYGLPKVFAMVGYPKKVISRYTIIDKKKILNKSFNKKSKEQFQDELTL